MARTDDVSDATRREPMTWLELAAEIRRTARATLGDRVPEDFWQHARAARKEELLALRSLLDARISQLEEDEQRRSERKTTKIPVQ